MIAQPNTQDHFLLKNSQDTGLGSFCTMQKANWQGKLLSGYICEGVGEGCFWNSRTWFTPKLSSVPRRLTPSVLKNFLYASFGVWWSQEFMIFHKCGIHYSLNKILFMDLHLKWCGDFPPRLYLPTPCAIALVSRGYTIITKRLGSWGLRRRNRRTGEQDSPEFVIILLQSILFTFIYVREKLEETNSTPIFLWTNKMLQIYV